MKKPFVGPIGEPPVLPNGTKVPLSPAYSAGGVVFLSGQLGFGSNGSIVSGGIEEQTVQTLANIDTLIQSIGASKHDIAKATVWLTKKDDFAGFNKAYAAYFGEHLPARSCVCSDLLVEGALVEIEVAVYRPD